MSKKPLNTKVDLPEALSVAKHLYLANIEWGTKRWEATKTATWNKGRSLSGDEIKKAREQYEANLQKKLAGGIKAPVEKPRSYIPPKKISAAHQQARNVGFVWPYDGLVF